MYTRSAWMMILGALGLTYVQAQDCASIIAGPDTVAICPGATLTLDGSGSTASQGSSLSAFQWIWREQTIGTTAVLEHGADTPGVYPLQLIVLDLTGCVDTSVVLALVSPEAELSFGTEGIPCVGDTLRTSARVIQRPLYHYAVQPMLLPDLDTVSFPMVIDQFPAGAVIQTGSEIASICVEMEHSFMGDLVIQLECPNGDTLVMHRAGGGGTFLGVPDDGDDSSPVPGGCWYYCWNTTASSNTWEQSSVSGAAPNLVYFGNDASLQAGEYRSVDPFTDLIGCPLNGTWTLNVADHLATDNGYLRAFNIQFAGEPSQGPDMSGVVVLDPQPGWNCDSITWQASGSITLDDACSSIQIVPTESGPQLINISVTDDHGCVSSGNTTINVLHFDPQIMGPTFPPYGVPVDYSVQESPGSPNYSWTSNLASVYFFDQPNAQAAWTSWETGWIAVKEFRGTCIGSDTLFMEGLMDIPIVPTVFVNAFPNPVENELNVPSAIAPPGVLSFRVFDHLGRLVRRDRIDEPARPFKLDTRTMPTGSYILEMEGSDEVRSLPFMVIH